jgi:hypothetical protein
MTHWDDGKVNALVSLDRSSEAIPQLFNNKTYPVSKFVCGKDRDKGYLEIEIMISTRKSGFGRRI